MSTAPPDRIWAVVDDEGFVHHPPDSNDERPTVEYVRSDGVLAEKVGDLAAREWVAVDALQEIAKVSIPEINPDGDDQAADTMRLWAVSALEHLGVTVPEQRVSVADDVKFDRPPPRSAVPTLRADREG
jgi:hypothetical protein